VTAATVAAYGSAEAVGDFELGCSAEYVVAEGIAGYVADASDGYSDDEPVEYAAVLSSRRTAPAAVCLLAPTT